MYIMKWFIFTCSLCLISITGLHGQFSVGLKAGISPHVNPQTNHMIVNRSDVAHTMLFNIEQVKYGEQVGLALRYDKHPWWFMTEVMYASSTATYCLESVISDLGVRPLFAEEKRAFLDLPVSAGVTLGILDIFSGFTLTRSLSYTTELQQVEGFVHSMPSWIAGWHTGIGICVHNVTFDLRYQQAFANYGQNRFINGEELTTLEDDTLSEGKIGFVLDMFEAGQSTAVDFDDLVIKAVGGGE